MCICIFQQNSIPHSDRICQVFFEIFKKMFSEAGKERKKENVACLRTSQGGFCQWCKLRQSSAEKMFA